MVRELSPSLFETYTPWISTIPLNKGMRWIPTWKSTPMDGSRLTTQDGQRVPSTGRRRVPSNIF